MRTRHYVYKDMQQLLIFFVSAAICFAFIELAGWVSAGGTQEVDRAIVLFFREASDLSDPIGPKWVEEMMRDITALGGVGMLVLMTLTVLGYLIIIGQKKAAMLVLIGISSGMLLSFSLKYGFSRPRPELVPHGSYVYTSSFPSGHAMMSALVYLTLVGLLAQQSLPKNVKSYFYFIAICLTLAIGVSRVYLGVHWPTDVLAGWLVGSGWALMIYYVYRIIRFRRLRDIID